MPLSDPAVRRPGAGRPTAGAPSQGGSRKVGAVDLDALEADLRAEVEGEVRFDDGSRAAYATDGSNFRQVPLGVVVPASVEDGVAAVAVCRRHGAPLLSRGGGTSLAGQCTNTAVVLDWSKHCDHLLSVDPDARRCVVEPGIVLDELNRQLAPYGLSYGPQPATHPNCTLGGMIGNNSCGATAQRTGKVVDNVYRLEVLCYDGTRFWCGETTEEEYDQVLEAGAAEAATPNERLRADCYRRLRVLVDTYGDEIRARYPAIPRRVSGYNLDSLLPEHGFDVAGLLVGSESTLVTVLRAELELVPVVKARTLVVLGYPGIAKAADAVPAILPHRPIALEGLDHRLIADEHRKHLHEKSLAELPEGAGWLMVQFGGDTTEESDAAAKAMLDALHETEHDPTVGFFDEPELEDELWEVREGGLGATAHVPGKRDTWEGWEDSAVAPERLGDYLSDLEALYEEFGYADETAPALYGHFGQGCVHTRIPFDLYSADGVATYRRFLDRAAELVVSYGGSLSGEHGDGQGRGVLLEKMFGPRLLRAFGELKAIFDHDHCMNPGKLVDPYEPDENLRLGGDWSPRPLGPVFFAYPEDEGSFVKAANRCVGVGKCRQHSSDGTVMCPSYQVTREEEHSTRGRARLLFEMLDGHHEGPIADGWRSKAVLEALDLCLACKGCKKDCPVSVDMATYKAEFLAHHYEGRLRPRHHYTMGFLPLAAQALSRFHLGPVFNAVGSGPLHRVVTALAGIEPRELPLFSRQSFQERFARHVAPSGPVRGEVLLWPDTFTNFFHPHVGEAAVEVLEAAGWKVAVPRQPLCCGLTWISTGQLNLARRALERTAAVLEDHVNRGGLVVGLEPSCTAVFRSDATELLPDNLVLARLREQTVTLAELLSEHSPGWVAPKLPPVLPAKLAQLPPVGPGGTGGPVGPVGTMGQHDGSGEGDRRGGSASGDTVLGAASRRRVLVQAHCHQHAILGTDADEKLLEAIETKPERLNSGCCGLAGNFGFEPGHLEVSRACAERVLLPRVRAAEADDVVLADGFSCRTQIHELGGGREAVHLAELLAAAVRQRQPEEGQLPEDAYAERPERPGRFARIAAAVAAVAVVASGAAAVGSATGMVTRGRGRVACRRRVSSCNTPAPSRAAWRRRRRRRAERRLRA